MMHHTQAIVLKNEEWGEADWLVTALTEDFGKIRLLAQGVRKHGAKLRGHLEPGSIADISFVVGRNGYRLTTARLRAFPASSRTSLSKLRALSAVLAALDQNLLEERDGAGELFGEVASVLAVLERAERAGTIQRLLVWFRLRLLKFLGLLPGPETPEAWDIRALLEFAARPLTALDGADVPAERLAREFTLLHGRLGGAVNLNGAAAAVAPRSAPDPTLY